MCYAAETTGRVEEELSFGRTISPFTSVFMSINHTHSVLVFFTALHFTALACDILQSLIRLPLGSKLHPFVVRRHKNRAFRHKSGHRLRLGLLMCMHAQPLLKIVIVD